MNKIVVNEIVKAAARKHLINIEGYFRFMSIEIDELIEFIIDEDLHDDEFIFEQTILSSFNCKNESERNDVHVAATEIINNLKTN